MSAPKRVSDARILEALTRWRGNVAASAQDVQISPNNFRARMKTLNVNLAAFRAGETVARRVAEGTPQAPEGIKGAKVRSPGRVSPAVQVRLREARWDLQALYRMEVDETASFDLSPILRERLSPSKVL